jgi:hypothetical protein
MTIERATIPEQVAEFLTAAGITYSVTLVGPTVRPDGGKGWECDEWRPVFRRIGTYAKPARKGCPDIARPFFTGTGLRKPGTKFTPAKPQAPDAASVLHSLILDGQAVDMSFRDWCDEMGDNPDSIRALDTYRECCDIGAELRAFFTAEERQALADMLADY